MRSLPAFALALAASGCMSPSGRSGAPLADTVQYTVRKTEAAKGQPSSFMVEAKLLSKGMLVQQPSLAIHDAKWATFKVGELISSIHDIQISPDEEDALPADVQIFSGTLLGFRCREGTDGKIEVRVRIYEVRNGILVAACTSNDSLVSGEPKTLIVTPVK